jgi:hypothetical protein
MIPSRIRSPMSPKVMEVLIFVLYARKQPLNAIQRTYPQIYSSNDKLKIDADKIKITAKDFMLSVKKMIPSSERSTSSGAAPLPKGVEPLLRDQLKKIEGILDGLIPIKKKTTALQEAMYEQYDDEDQGIWTRDSSARVREVSCIPPKIAHWWRAWHGSIVSWWCDIEPFRRSSCSKL